MLRWMIVGAAMSMSAQASTAADMRIVCETRGATIDRLDVSLPEGGEPVLLLSAGQGDPLFTDEPEILSHVLTRAGPDLDGRPFSTMLTEFKVNSLGVERIFTPQTYYVDWDRAKVWKSFFNLLDEPGSAEIKNCVRVD